MSAFSPSSPPPDRRSVVAPILITIFMGAVLAVGSCFGFLSTMNQGAHAGDIYVDLFFIGCFLLLAGGIWAVVAFILWFIRTLRAGGGDDSPQPPPQPGSAGHR